MASESGWFDFSDVVHGICDKMVRRHPHVFAGEQIADAEAQSHAWEAHKRRERGAASGGVLDGVPLALPALIRITSYNVCYTKLLRSGCTGVKKCFSARELFEEVESDIK